MFLLNRCRISIGFTFTPTGTDDWRSILNDLCPLINITGYRVGGIVYFEQAQFRSGTQCKLSIEFNFCWPTIPIGVGRKRASIDEDSLHGGWATLIIA